MRGFTLASFTIVLTIIASVVSQAQTNDSPSLSVNEAAL
jgi:hypothetical protein